jgi:TATA-box binding protein (TBP) (component of TFIID and TFIIIB)
MSDLDSDLKLLTLVCKASINCHFNLELIALKLKLNETIIGKKMIGIIEENRLMPNEVEKSKKKIKIDQKRKDFSNQLTIKIINYELKETNNTDISINYLKAINKAINNKITDEKSKHRLNLNMKTFRNGSIIITGSIYDNDALFCVNKFIDAIRDINEDVSIKYKEITDLFLSISDYIKFMSNNFLIILYMCYMFNINIDLKLNNILDLSTEKKSFTSLNQMPYSYEYSKLLQVYMLCRKYFNNNEILVLLQDTKSKLYDFCNKLYNEEIVNIEATFYENISMKDVKITPINFNSKFNIGFNIDRDKLSMLLNNTPEIISANYDSTGDYQGINVKYRNYCEDHIDNKDKEIKCKECKKISILMFQEGKIIITGTSDWNQNIEAYEFIVNFVTKHRDEIEIKINKEQNVNLLPLKINLNGNIYLNKNSYIFKSPKNLISIKKLNLYDVYKT